MCRASSSISCWHPVRTERPSVRPLLWVALALIVAMPLAASLLSPLQAGRAVPWVWGTLAGVAALSLLVVQLLLPSGWSYRALYAQNLRWHRRLGLVVTGLVVTHIGGLYLYSPDDIGDALVLQAPTYSRLGVLAAWCMVLSVGLALARRRLPLQRDDWQIMHSTLAVAITGLAVGHVVMLEGTLDGPVEWVLCAAAVGAVTTTVVYWHMLRPSRRR